MDIFIICIYHYLLTSDRISICSRFLYALDFYVLMDIFILCIYHYLLISDRISICSLSCIYNRDYLLTR